MAVIILPRRTLALPSSALEVDWDNPITAGLLAAGLPGIQQESVTRGVYVRIGTPAIDAGALGVGLRTNGSTSAAYVITPSVAVTTLTLFGAFEGTGGGSDRRAVSLGLGANNNNYLTLGTGSTNSQKMRVVAVGNGLFQTDLTVETAASVFDGNLHTAALAVDVASALLSSYVDGRPDAATTPAPGSVFNLDRLAFGALQRTGSVAFWAGLGYMGAAWTRVLTPDEQRSMHYNPGQLWRAASRRTYFGVTPATSASTITPATSASTTSTLVGASICAATIIAAAGASATGTLVGSATQGSAITPAASAATTGTFAGSAISAAAVTPAASAATTSTLTTTVTRAAVLTPTASVATTSTLVGGTAGTNSIIPAVSTATTGTLAGKSTAASALTPATGLAVASPLAGKSTWVAALVAANSVATTGVLFGSSGGGDGTLTPETIADIIDAIVWRLATGPQVPGSVGALLQDTSARVIAETTVGGSLFAPGFVLAANGGTLTPETIAEIADAFIIRNITGPQPAGSVAALLQDISSRVIAVTSVTP